MAKKLMLWTLLLVSGQPLHEKIKLSKKPNPVTRLHL
jgi:hypothetical protein